MVARNLESLGPAHKRALLERLLREKVAADTVNLVQEAQIELAVDRGGVDLSVVEHPGAILLTGVTGFVGAFLVRELIRRTSAQLHCLVRAPEREAGLRRIRENMQKYGVWDEAYAARIVVVLGDLSKPRMNLDDSQLQTLAEEVDVIYHIAATVNLAYKYRMLKATNVDGTRDVLKLASTGRVKPVHYLSSYAPFDSVHNAGKTIFERDIPAHSDGLSTGYNETKWVAETMVRNAREQGLPAAIYRVGWVVGHTKSGVWNDSDFIPRLIQACTTLGKYTYLGEVTMTPVDYLVESLVALSRRRASIGDTFHLSNGERYSTRQLFDWVKGFGFPVEEVSYESWEQAMLGSSQEAALMPMKLFLESAAPGVKLSDWFAREPIIDSRYTREILAGSVTPPRLDQGLMNTYLSYFISSGYLDPPR